MVGEPFGTFGSGEDAEIGDAEALQAVKLALQALRVAAAAVGGQDGGIPEVGAGEGIYGVAA